jgi:hypothetical protein
MYEVGIYHKKVMQHNEKAMRVGEVEDAEKKAFVIQMGIE